MAYPVTNDEVWIDQTLHGYSSGHRLLTGSAKLADAEARTMLVLSDASGGRFIDQDHGYLTGYPLPGASKYVVSRTWRATEMTRPGCVWTHSLLIGFADLARLTSAEGLLSALRRPYPSIADFDTKLRLPLGSGLPASTRHAGADALVNALYLNPASKIEMKGGDPAEDEELLLAIWLQQWPRLRRSFRFCSSVGADRSTEGAAFDVQVTGSGSAPGRAVVAGSHPVVPSSVDPRLEGAVHDLRAPGDLRSFLRKVGGDVPGGRSAMIALCQLHDVLERAGRHETSYSAALDAFDLLGSGQARAARAIVLEQALSDIDDVDERTFGFICQSMVEDEAILDPGSARRVGGALWRRSPMDFAVSLSDEGPIGQAAKAAAESMNIEALADGVVAEPMIASRLVLVRSDLLATRRFWQASLPDVNAMLQVVDEQNEETVLKAIVASARADAASAVVRRFGSARTLMAIGQATTVQAASWSEWLDWIARDPAPLGLPLSSGRLARELIIGLSQRIDPDIVPNDYGDDPWLIAAQAEGRRGAPEEKRFAAFLLARALGSRSRSPAELLRIAFDRVHGSLGDGSMPYEGWQIVERCLPWPMPWGEWDKCGRVREAVTAKFVDYDLSPEIFSRLTDSGSAFHRMAEIAAKTKTGRRYLDRVRKAIRNEPEEFMHSRAKMIGKLI